MADQKLSELTELAATPAVDDEVYIRDVSEAAAAESKRITIANLIPAMVFSSKCRVYRGTSEQVIPNGSNIVVHFNTESFDILNEFDSSSKSGAADATEANKLHDADGGFAAGDVGAIVWNTTDNTYATVSAFVDSGELTLDTDIMVNGENYTLYQSKFTATNTGYYIVAAAAYFKSCEDGKRYVCRITVNDTSVAYQSFMASAVDNVSAVATIIVALTAADYVRMTVYNGGTAAKNIDDVASLTYMSIHRLS